MADMNVKLTESVIRQIMEGTDPRTAIDNALEEKAGYHKEKRIRDGKATTVNVKNTKRKVHHTLTADQKKAIKKAHSAAANKKRAKSLKKGAKMGLYQGKDLEGTVQQESMQVQEAEEEIAVTTLGIACPACTDGQLEIFQDPEGEETDGTILVCPECGKTFVICDTEELEDDDDDKEDDDKEEEAPAEDAAADEEVPQDEATQVADAAPVAEEAPVDGDCSDENCDGEECKNECGEPESESGLFFAAE